MCHEEHYILADFASSALQLLEADEKKMASFFHD